MDTARPSRGATSHGGTSDVGVDTMTGGPPASATEHFAVFALGLTLDDVPADVLGRTALHLLDTIGCGIAAIGTGAAAFGTAYGESAPDGPASAMGVARGIRPAEAALVNGIACHALDFDDTSPQALAHVGAVTVPASLAAAETASCSGEQLLLALVAGAEVTSRIGTVAGDALHLRGFHPTAICGVFGATTAVARLAGLSVPETVCALGIVGSMASGLMAYLSDGSSTKQLHPGWAAHSAYTAVQLARHGATGPAAVLEDRKGLFAAYLGRSKVSSTELARDLGSEWLTRDLSIKPYPACHFIHAPLDALRALHVEREFAPEDVRRITVFTPEAGAALVSDPPERKARPSSPYESKFSAPFALAAWLRSGTADATTFAEPLLSDPGVLALAAMVDYEIRDYDTFPESLPGGVRVELASGEVRERHLLHHRGGSHLPLTPNDVTQKFRANARVGLSKRDMLEVERWALDIQSEPGMGALSRLRGCRQVDPTAEHRGVSPQV